MIFFSLALLIALCVQSMASPLAGAWLLFFWGACVTLRDSGAVQRAAYKDAVWWACFLWLSVLGISAFLLAPVRGGAATLWILAAMPLLPLCLPPEKLLSYLRAALVVLSLYALLLICAFGFQMHSPFEIYKGTVIASSWPLLDPNNAACLMNMALIPCFWLVLHRDARWFALFLLFALALACTLSKAGGLVGLIACGALLLERYPKAIVELAVIALALLVCIFHQPTPASLLIRADLWLASLDLLQVHPLTGIGLGMFSQYYPLVRTEHSTAGVFAHNDVLQLAIEMGLPAVVFFLAIPAAMVLTARNRAATAVVLAVYAQSLAEFQFYVPAVSLCMGLALASRNLILPQK